MMDIFYSIFNNGFGYSEISLHPTFDGCVKEIAMILKRPENYNQLPTEIRDNLTTWDAIYDNLLELDAPYRTKWIIEIGCHAMPGFLNELKTEKKEQETLGQLKQKCLDSMRLVRSASFDCIDEQRFLSLITEWSDVSQRAAETTAFIAKEYYKRVSAKQIESILNKEGSNAAV